MSQMVLPQNFPSKAPSEAPGPSGSSRPGQEKSAESHFDAVSRSEQKRLDAEKADKAEKAAERAKAAEKTGESDDASEARRADKAEQTDKQSAHSEAERPGDAKNTDAKTAAAETPGEQTGQNPAVEAPDLVLEPDSDALALAMTPDATLSAPVTFAGLQSLVESVQTQNTTPATTTPLGTGPSANGQGLPFQGSLMSLSVMNGSAKNGSMTLQTPGQGNSLSGGALTEALLAGVTGDGAKASDSPMLQNAIRFQGALESASAQANAVNTPKMAPDANILRGYTTSIDVPVSHAEWGDKMAGKLTWLTARNMSVAEIHLTPPDMGPLEVKVQVQQEQANITVHSANPVVREQLELHSHRLRDMLSEQGFSLEQFDVSDSNRDQAGDGEAGAEQSSGEGLMAGADQDDFEGESRSLDLTWKGEVDIFA